MRRVNNYPMTCYTAIFGNYDDLKEPKVVTDGWEYICFTDQPLKSDVWQIIQRPLIGDARRTSKHYKIKFHEHIADPYSLWVDASFIINCNLNEWWQSFKAPMTLLKHPRRNCVYEEAAACIKNRRDNVRSIQKHIQYYGDLKLPKAAGMAASGIMMRERTEETIAFADLWYRELEKGCARDQISYAYANWKIPIANLLDWDYTKRTEFIYLPHLTQPDKRKLKLSYYKKQNIL